MTKLKERRLIEGLSQSELAEKSGVSFRMIQQYEQGQQPMDKAEIGTILRLSVALGCAVYDILETDELVALAVELNN